MHLGVTSIQSDKEESYILVENVIILKYAGMRITVNGKKLKVLPKQFKLICFANQLHIQSDTKSISTVSAIP